MSGNDKPVTRLQDPESKVHELTSFNLSPPKEGTKRPSYFMHVT